MTTKPEEQACYSCGRKVGETHSMKHCQWKPNFAVWPSDFDPESLAACRAAENQSPRGLARAKLAAVTQERDRLLAECARVNAETERRPRSTEATVERWEHDGLVTQPHYLKDVLKPYGEAGWEAVAMYPSPQGLVVLIKRRLPPVAP